MLILVAVTISMAVNGGLFDYAGNAGAQTNGAIANEQEFANLEANMTVDQLIDKYTGWTEEGNEGETIQCEKCTDGYIIIYQGPNKLRTPCPDCSINFTVFGEYNYTAAKGSTWAEFIENVESALSVDGDYVGDGYGIFVHYKEGERVKPTDPILSRI